MSLKKVETFLKLCMDVIQMGITLIDGLEIKIKNNDDTNHCMYQIISTCNYLSICYNYLPNDSNGNILRGTYNLILKKKLEKNICFILNNNDNTKNVDCFSFYETNLKKSAVNSELLSKVQKQNGGMYGIIHTAIVVGLATITILSNLSLTESNVFNKQKFVDNENALNIQKPYPLNYFSNNELWGTCAVNVYVAKYTIGGFCTDTEWKAADPNVITRFTTGYTWETYMPNTTMMESNTKRATFSFPVGYMIDDGEFTTVSSNDGYNLDWFRNYFKEGEQTQEAIASKLSIPKITDIPFTGVRELKAPVYSDVAVAIVYVKGHVMNVMYDREKGLLCSLDENKRSLWNDITQSFEHGNEQYTCEPGFFSNEQLEDLGKSRVKISNNPLVTDYGQILMIEKLPDIYKHDNSQHTGSADDVVRMHIAIRKALVAAQHANINFIKKTGNPNVNISKYEEEIGPFDKVFTTPSTFRRAIDVSKKMQNPKSNEKNALGIAATMLATYAVHKNKKKTAATAATATATAARDLKAEQDKFNESGQNMYEWTPEDAEAAAAAEAAEAARASSWNWFGKKGGKKTIKKFSKKNKKSVVKKNKKSVVKKNKKNKSK